MIDSKALETELLEIIGHLGAALVQSIDSDDQIIMGHVRDAHELAKALRRQALATARQVTEGRVVAIGDHDVEFSRVLDITREQMGAKQ